MKLMTMLCALTTLFFAISSQAFLPRTALDSLSTIELQETWVLESAVCNDGTPGELRYEAAVMDINYYGNVNVRLQQESCDIDLEGTWTAEVAPAVLTTEFTSGTWSGCSGQVPSYILNRFGYTEQNKKLVLVSNDLSPFASCHGKEGQLIFRVE